MVMVEEATTIAKNILRYLPVLPRIQRLFMTEDTAQQMRWAMEGNGYTDKMIHSSDGSAWKNFVKKFPLKAGDPRSVAVAISTDGFNPYDDEREDAGMDEDNAEDEAEDVCAPEDPSLLEAFKAGMDLDADGPRPGFIDDYWFAEPDDDDETCAKDDDEVEDGSEEDQEQHGGGEDEQHEGGEDVQHYGGGEDEQHGGGEEEEDEGHEEDLSEDEGLGNLPYEPGPNLLWEAQEEHQYIAAEERLRPRDRRPYQRGKTWLPLPKTWPYSHVVLEPAGRSSFMYEDPLQRLPCGYPNILGGLLRRYFPGLVDLPTGGRDVAWRWAHYRLAPDPLGRYDSMHDVKYFTKAEGKEIVCDDVLHQMARTRMTGMHYEARIQCVRNWHVDRFVHMTKGDARDTLMHAAVANPPQYVGNDEKCFLAMVMWWTCPQYLKKHAEGKMKWAEMRGGSHIQGSIPISLHMQNEAEMAAKEQEAQEQKGAYGAADYGLPAAAGTADAADATTTTIDDPAAPDTDELTHEPNQSVFSTGE
ncbi:hypothetical protein QYE76_024731 [Lolium multiflorum]|uniref:Uncharacterized protein n=1 Tax=Lolium multiflorum TaxID=4521 RepID=A0AAD8RGN5_LOLMU|nr:hypothetical protein QYE76_024731 [Lolium multiflorum]